MAGQRPGDGRALAGWKGTHRTGVSRSGVARLLWHTLKQRTGEGGVRRQEGGVWCAQGLGLAGIAGCGLGRGWPEAGQTMQQSLRSAAAGFVSPGPGPDLSTPTTVDYSPAPT
eukprot:3553965-Rhodomonas_salina.1